MKRKKLDELLTNSAQIMPDKLAVIDPGIAEVTYGELQEIAQTISERLLSANIGNNDRVGICMPKSITTVASIFASLSSGACHVPVDPNAPASRNAYIFSNCAVKAIIVHRPLLASLQAELSQLNIATGEVIPVEIPIISDQDLVIVSITSKADDVGLTDQDLAYILYTSGSTGKPKGVMHSHSTAFSFIDWCSEEFKPTAADRFSSHAPFHFDLSILDLYVAIKHQATLVLISDKQGKEPMGLASLISDYRISVWYSTPSILRMLLDYGKIEDQDFSALRLVLYAGEVFPLKHLRALSEQLPGPKYYNLYGPTETNVCTYHHVATPIADIESLPQVIGRVCSGDQARVVDGSMNDVKTGEEGELWIAGGSVHLGYWNLPAQNSTAFSTDANGVVWYKTGDLVIEQEDNTFLFLGRRDRMVKRRGFRVELGEIETTLYSHPNIVEVAVIATPDTDNGLKLVAFINWTGDSPPSIIGLKRFSSENLLSYMIPDRFVFVDELPKTSTDKIDYQKLLEM